MSEINFNASVDQRALQFMPPAHFALKLQVMVRARHLQFEVQMNNNE